MWGFFIGAVVIVVLWLRLRSVEALNRALKVELADVREEIRAVRQAFLRRIAVLEGADAAREPAAGGNVPAEPPPPPEHETAVTAEPAPQTPAAVEEPAKHPPPPSPQPHDETKRIDWEHWVGVRGAAILGSAVFGLAAVFFLQYSIEHDLISPALRVTAGFLAGVVAVAVSELLRRKNFLRQADALAGGGMFALYAATWAANVLYGFIGGGAAFALAALITLACGYISWRNHALSTALLGLFGGFASPLLLSTGQDQPITLFSYLLMLNIGLYALARARNWPLVPALAMAATVFYQASWILAQMGAERSWLGLTILGVFAAFYFLTALTPANRERGALEKLTHAAGFAAPFGLTTYFAASAELSPHLLPLAALLTLLSLASVRLGREAGMEILPTIAAAADVGIASAWVSQTTFDFERSWELSLATILLAGAFHGPYEWLKLTGRATERDAQGTAALCSAGGLLLLLIPAQAFPIPQTFGAWLTALTALCLLLVRQDYWRPRVRGAWVAAAVGAGFALAILYRPPDGEPSRYWLYLLGLLYSAALLATSLPAAGRPRARALLRASVLSPLALLVGSFPLANAPYVSDLFFLAIALLFGTLIAIAARQLGNGGLLSLALLPVAFIQWLWAIAAPAGAPAEGPLLLLFGSTLFFTAWPLLARELRENRWALRCSALAAPFGFAALYETFEHVFGGDSRGVLPLVLAAVSAAALLTFRRSFPNLSQGSKQHGTVWYAAVALSFIAIAIPFQLQKEWVLIGWALQGAVLLQLWRKLDHPGLKYFALALLALVTVWLLLPDAWAFHPRSGRPILNWLLYTYLVPAAALIAGAIGLRTTELARTREWESAIYRAGRPIGAGLCGLASILVIFVWINLAVLDIFSTGRQIDFAFEQTAARDLVLSLAWTLYALTLLAIGFRTRIRSLRWVSLFFLLLTIGKVFLYDLGELEDLYRVASLLGLALSLILISLAYQRFVFRHTDD